MIGTQKVKNIRKRIMGKENKKLSSGGEKSKEVIQGKDEMSSEEITEEKRDIKEEEKDIYNEIRKLLVKMPSVWNILNILTERGTNLSKTIIQAISGVIREELRLFFKSINLIEIVKSVLSDTAIELKIEVTFKDKRKPKSKED